MFYIGCTLTLLDKLIEDILGIVEFHEVGRTLLEVLHEETLGIVEFHEVSRTLLTLGARPTIMHREPIGSETCA